MRKEEIKMNVVENRHRKNIIKKKEYNEKKWGKWRAQMDANPVRGSRVLAEKIKTSATSKIKGSIQTTGNIDEESDDMSSSHIRNNKMRGNHQEDEKDDLR